MGKELSWFAYKGDKIKKTNLTDRDFYIVHSKLNSLHYMCIFLKDKEKTLIMAFKKGVYMGAVETGESEKEINDGIKKVNRELLL